MLINSTICTANLSSSLLRQTCTPRSTVVTSVDCVNTSTTISLSRVVRCISIQNHIIRCNTRGISSRRARELGHLEVVQVLARLNWRSLLRIIAIEIDDIWNRGSGDCWSGCRLFCKRLGPTIIWPTVSIWGWLDWRGLSGW